MVYSEVPNFSEPNPDLLAQANQQNKMVRATSDRVNYKSKHVLHWLIFFFLQYSISIIDVLL